MRPRTLLACFGVLLILAAGGAACGPLSAEEQKTPGEVGGDGNTTLTTQADPGLAASSNPFAHAALRVNYCLASDSPRSAQAIYPDTPGAYACSLQLTFSQVPLCSGYAPSAPFDLIQMVVPVRAGTYPLPPSPPLYTLLEEASTFYVEADSYGDPTSCRDEGPLTAGALCAAEAYQRPATAGSFTLDTFVDGGTQASRATGSFKDLVLPARPASTTPRGEILAPLSQIGPSSGSFDVSSCDVGLMPPGNLSISL